MKVTKNAKVDGLNWSAEDWELYSSRKGSEVVAHDLNNTFMDAVNSGKSRREVQRVMHTKMRKHAGMGADDSEPIWKLESLLDKVFGEEDDTDE